MNAIESLVGAPPINDTKIKSTLEDIMKRLDTLENNVPSMIKINEIDRKIDVNFNKVNGYIRNATKRVKSLHSLKDHSGRISNLEETFETLAATLSLFKPKKKTTPIDKGSKFIFVPKNTTRVDASFEGKDELRMLKEAHIFKDSRGGAPLGKAFTAQLLLLIVLLEVLFQVAPIMKLMKMTMILILKRLDIWHCA